jgi:hypothetical protein
MVLDFFFEDKMEWPRFLRQAQDTEFIEVQGQPLPTGPGPDRGRGRQAEPLTVFGWQVEGLS